MRQRGLSIVLALCVISTSLIFIAPAKAAVCTPQVTTNGNQTVVTFKSVGTCTWNTPAGLTSFKGLIVAGGGGGGSAMGGGGGGGGYVEFNTLSAAADVFSITVGAGGSGAPTGGTTPASSGGSSSLTGTGINLVARGGASGSTNYASNTWVASSNGGSGGGSSGSNDYPGSFPQDRSSIGTQSSQTQTPSLSSISGSQFGFNGGAPGFRWYPSGGGGAGGSGSNTPGTGGVGRANAILGTNYFWAGGGGGSGWSGIGGNGGNGGGGGGGSGSFSSGIGGSGGSGLSNGAAGVYEGGAGGENTGGGGGAGTHSNYAGGRGGSGIVILSYLSYVGPASISIQLASSATFAVYRSTSTIEALTDVAGKVSFFQAGKPISGCRTKSTTGVSPNIKATCTWKPSNRGNIALTARITPSSDSYSASTSSTYIVPVRSRTTPR